MSDTSDEKMFEPLPCRENVKIMREVARVVLSGARVQDGARYSAVAVAKFREGRRVDYAILGLPALLKGGRT